MSDAQNRRNNRRQAQAELAQLFDQTHNVNVIHYSCESFYNRPDGSSPRITSIAVRNLQNAQTISFSIHQVAERSRLTRDEIETQYDRLEKQMLDEFYEFVLRRDTFHWLHWNMRDINFGFQAIAHRYRVLGGTPEPIDETKLHDLARLLFAIYGAKYADHPRLVKVIRMNNITDKDLLVGEDEAKAFEDREYVKLHRSTLRKVDSLASIAQHAHLGKLITKATWREVYGADVAAWIEVITEHWLFKLIGIIGAIFLFYEILQAVGILKP